MGYPKEITEKYRIVHDIWTNTIASLERCDAYCLDGFYQDYKKWREAVKSAKKTGRKIAAEFHCSEDCRTVLWEVDPIIKRSINLYLKKRIF